MTKTIKLRIRKPANEQATQQLLEMARVDNPNKDTNILGTKGYGYMVMIEVQCILTSIILTREVIKSLI